MRAGRNITIVSMAVGTTFLACGALYSQTRADSNGDKSGFTLYEPFEGSSRTLGQVTRLNSAVGYSFNRHFSADAGPPTEVEKSQDGSVVDLGCLQRHSAVGAY